MTESKLIVHKGICLPSRHTVTVIVRFESQLISAWGRDATFICLPERMYDKQGQTVDICFPAHICNGKQPNPGRYHLVVTNPSDNDIVLQAGVRIGTARVIDPAAIATSVREAEYIDADGHIDRTRMINVVVSLRRR